MRDDTDETTRYAQMGLAALLPGMQFMIDTMQAQLDSMRTRLMALQEGAAAPEAKRRGVGRPRKLKERFDPSVIGKTGWPEDPQERSKEMKRRQAVAREKKYGKFHVSDPRNPNHERWLRKIKLAGQKRWGNMTVKQRKLKMEQMAAARVTKAAKKAQAA